MQASAQDSGIRAISLLRRIGSMFVVLIIFLLFFFNVYHRIHDRLWIDDLKEIREHGVSQLAKVEEEYKIQQTNQGQQLTFRYSFHEGDDTYRNTYVLHHGLPRGEDVRSIFTVHYLKDDPDKNTLNIDEETARLEKVIADSSFFWLLIKGLIVVIMGLILITQLLALVTEIKNINKPIEIPGYQKK